jgi:hypothetical protein
MIWLLRTPGDYVDLYFAARLRVAAIPGAATIGGRLPSKIPSSLMRCVCGVIFDSHKPTECYDHRLQFYAARPISIVCTQLEVGCAE